MSKDDPDGPDTPNIAVLEHSLTAYFSEAEIELRKEVRHHPELLAIIAMADAHDFYEALAHIAAYCGIVLDGAYTQDDIDMLCKELAGLLYTKRTSVAVPGTLKRLH